MNNITDITVGTMIETTEAIANGNTRLDSEKIKMEYFLISDIEHINVSNISASWAKIHLIQQKTLRPSWISDAYFNDRLKDGKIRIICKP